MLTRSPLISTIQSQNQILVLHSQRARLQEQARDIQDVMRKVRERHIDIKDSLYCQLGGTYIKKHPHEVYPVLEGQLARVMALKDESHMSLKSQMNRLSGAIRDGKVNKNDLDGEVLGWLTKWEEDEEDQSIKILKKNRQ